MKMKILIVDDQLVSRMKIQKILENICNSDAVDCGQAAIDAFKQALDSQSPYDLITLDVSMPDMDGRQVLQTIRKLEFEKKIAQQRQVKILMITSSSDKDTVLSSIEAGCDDYLVKPLNRETISKKLEKFGLILAEQKPSEDTVHKMVDTTIQRFKKGELDLPAMPQIVREIQKVMNNSAASVEAVAALIEKDISMAVKLIATANSPLYRGVEKIQSVQAAISRLGLKEIQDIVNAIANKSLYETKHRQLKQLLDKLWLHSLASAHAARRISEQLDQTDLDKAFMGGLVHDIGSVLLLKSLGEIVPPGRVLDQAEVINSVYEVHANFGAALLDKWAFTQDFVRIAKVHEWTHFGASTEQEVLIVNLADNLTHNMGYGFFEKEPVDLLELESVKALQIDEDTLKNIQQQVSQVMEDSTAAF
jgi:HD-like signal output (HDOD) protein